MKSILITILTFVSLNLFGQTNYNTILNQPKDSLPNINLNLEKVNKIDNAAHIMFVAAVVSTISIYQLNPKSAAIFILPATLSAGSISLFLYKSRFK